jgi:Histidine kinase-like ATPase domain
VAGVELRFPPTAGHVRTARLVAAAVARRAGLDEVRLEDFRVAVGEACARAVRRCEGAGSVGPVVLLIDDTGPDLVVEVTDGVGPGEGDEPVSLALLRGLADKLEVLDDRPVGHEVRSGGATGTRAGPEVGGAEVGRPEVGRPEGEPGRGSVPQPEGRSEPEPSLEEKASRDSEGGRESEARREGEASRESEARRVGEASRESAASRESQARRVGNDTGAVRGATGERIRLIWTAPLCAP